MVLVFALDMKPGTGPRVFFRLADNFVANRLRLDEFYDLGNKFGIDGAGMKAVMP